MSSQISFELCDSEFWDANITWYTSKPQFSPCFRDTALVWLPAIILLIATAYEFYNLRRAKKLKIKPIPWNVYNRSRILLTFILFLVKISEAISYIYILTTGSNTPKQISSRTNDGVVAIYQNEGHVLVISSLLAPIIQAVSYVIVIILYSLQRKAGLHTSGCTWFYLLIAIFCDLFEFYSVIASIRPAINNVAELIVKLIHFPLLIVLFILECRGDTPIIEIDLTDDRPDAPEIRASFFSSITFWWYNGFLLAGYRRKIEFHHLWKTLARDRSSDIVPVLKSAWTKLGKKSSSKKKTYQLSNGRAQPKNNVTLVLLKIFWVNLLFAASLKLMQDSLQFLTPMVLKKLLQFMSSDGPEWHGTLYAMLLLIIPTIQSLILANYFYHMQVLGIQVKTMLIGFIYRKALLLSGSSRMQSTSGEIVNLMAVDSQRFQELLMYGNLWWSAPFQIFLSILLLYRELGWSVFAGVACMALVLPANAFLASRIKRFQIKLMKTKDERVKQVNEILGGIKVIKLYAWENSFISSLFGFRSRELQCLKQILNLDSVQTFLWQCSPFVVSCVTFAVYVYSDPSNILDAEKAFVSISLFNLLKFPLTMLPMLVTNIILTVVSARRLNKFLNNDEIVRYVTRNDELEAVAIEGGTLSWSQDEEVEGGENPDKKAILRDINLHVKSNSFVAVIGQVASGKSSLLAAILGEMHRIAGRFNVQKGLEIAYVPQQAWIQNMTVRDNILFGSHFNEERYRQVLSVCSLESDLEIIPGGDQAEIGEKGINLSGGQKQRVSLARACYSNSDLFLLDDPLSALDSHVAKHVFDKVLSSTTGLLRNKTRILATNCLFVLPYVDQIIVLDNGRIIESGTYKDLMKIDGGYLSECMRQYSGTPNNQPSGAVATEEHKSFEQVLSAEEKLMKSVIPKSDVGKLIDIEKTETGSVNYKVYLSYFKAVSIRWLVFVVISLVAASALNVSTNFWLSIWSSDSKDPKRRDDANLKLVRLIVYTILGGSQCLIILIGAFALSFGAVRASRRLHSNLLERVMHSPMTFFDTTPIGRIVNRFAKDIDVVDSMIPGTLRSWMNCLLQVASTIFIICYSFPTFLIIIIPLGIIYYLIQKVFIVTTRQLKRLESITRSPIYSHFNETLSGTSTIRAYDCVDRFVSYSDSLIDRNQACVYPTIMANRWLGIRLEFFGNLITACAALFSVYYRETVGAGVAGLCISYSLSITQTLSWLVRMNSDLETNIVSVERIMEYTKHSQEDEWIKEKRPKSDWPDKGSISIQGYSTRYREETDLVLRDMSIDIKPREKIGIVGRTGSGKSSLSLSLFRILEPASGKIFIDDLDITEYGLHDLRSKLTIIPQDPVLFSGTLRFNLDPLKLHSDMEIWRSIELANLKQSINTSDVGLDYKVQEFGENFSVGQKQLICLARAILRKSRILILDEATASVDLETDSIVQKTIREIFNDCTIITIAHRLHTILDSDRILVLDKGRVKELDSPANLISDSNSAFSSLIRDAGIEIQESYKT